ncbi:MAG: Ig-like domain-containing protein, partial [Deltaproteobacteria bacterium]|nr:Ig-like domain-containing protein [Deltaproteobacteria bacterium]
LAPLQPSAFSLQPVDFTLTSATGRVVPQAAPPSAGLRAAGDLLLIARADAAPAPALTSGLVINASVTEKFDLTSGDKLQPAATVQDIVLYRTPCATSIAAGATEPLDPALGLRTTFPVAPSRDFTIVDLLLGKITIDITPPDTSGGIMVGIDGARLLQPDGTALSIPAGALTGTAPVTVATIPEASLTTLVGADFRLLRGIDVAIGGQSLKSSATLSIPAPAGFDPALPVIVAKKFDVKGGSKLKLVAMGRLSGSIINSEPLAAEIWAGAPRPYIDSTGQYLFLQAVAPIGYVSGQITDAAAAAFAAINISAQSATLADLTGIDGRYLLALATGERSVTALDATRGDTASGDVTIAANTKSVLNLTVRMVPPTVVAISPANGAANVQPSVAVAVTFSKQMDKNSINSQTLKLTNSTGTTVPGVITWNAEATIATFYPAEAFKQETGYSVTIASTVKDLQGYPLGQDVVSSFTIRKTTPPPMPPAGSVSASYPDADGFITITATQGTAPADCTVLLINNTSGEIVSVTPATNGSFSGRVRGQIGDEIKVVIMDYSGNQTLVSYLTFKSADGKYLVTAKGGKVEGEGGSLLDIPEGALIGPVEIKVTALQEANLPSPLQTPGKYLAAFNIDSGGINFQKEVHLSIPVPAGFDPKTPVFVTKPSEIYNEDGTIEKVYEIIDSTKIVNGRITTASPPFDGITGMGSYIFTAFPDLTVGIVSGYTYQDMNELPGYQPAPPGVVEIPEKDAMGNLIYKYDRPVQGAVIRTPASWNYVSFSKFNGSYAGFTTLFANVGARSLEYKIAAIHPQTMRRVDNIGYLSADGTLSYNIVDLNFKLAEKNTIIPDKTAPIITIDMQVAPGQAPDTRIIAGTVPVGTEIKVPIFILDQQMGNATLTVTFTDLTSSEPNSVVLSQSGMPTLFTPQTGAKPAIWRYNYATAFQAPIAATNPANFRPNRIGLYNFVVEATDNAGNIARQSMQLRVVGADTSLGESRDGPPTIDSITPSDKAKDVMVSMPITAVFSEPVTNVTSDTFKLIDLTAGKAPGVTVEVLVPATVTTSIVNGRMQAVLTPRGNLYYDRDYQVLLTSGIKDLPDKNDSATSADKLFPLAEVRTAFSTKKPTSYDLASKQFIGRDIDLYYNRETMKLYSYVTAGDKGWRVVDVTDPTAPGVVYTAASSCVANATTDCQYVSTSFDFRSVAVHPDPDRALMAMTDTVNFNDGNLYGYVRFYSLANPALPVSVGREKLAEAFSGIPGRLALYDNYAFIATINAGIQVVSITQAVANQEANKSSDGSSIVGVFDSVGQGLGHPSDIIVLNGVNALFTTTSGSLVVLDITTPALPTLVTSIGQNDGRHYTRVASAMQYQYMDADNIPRSMDLVMAGSREGLIRTIDMTNPTSPQILAVAKDETGLKDAAISTTDLVIDKESSLAFVTGLGTVYVIDIKDPFKPKLINRFTSLYDPSGARDATGASITIPLGQTPAIVERGGWIYAANQQTGVKILNFDPPTIVPTPGRYFVLLNESNAAQQAYQFSYHIKTDPGTNGDFENMRVVIYKDNVAIKTFTDILPDTPMTLIEAGTGFAINSSYHARVIVYDKQTKNDVPGPDVPIVVGKFEISAEDEKYKDLKGAATDGTALLTLKLRVTPNYNVYKPVFSLEDPDLGTDTNATGLMLYQGGWTGAFVAQFDAASQSFKAIYRVPQTYVRYGTSMEATDKTGAERVVNVDLGITDIKPVIKLRRPPVVLVHGLWAKPDSWDTFEPVLNKHDQFLVTRANYEITNADAILNNYIKVKDEIEDTIIKMRKKLTYAPKVNVIGHSMGGLLTKEYCRMNRSECKEKINKFISIDTPHKGSEMAQQLFDIDKNKPFFCYHLVLTNVDKKKGVWTDPSRTNLNGALLDLIPGSPALTRLDASVMPINWSAIAGVAESGKIYDEDLSELWKYLQTICGKKPDSSFPKVQQDPVFNTPNDRIVNQMSQFGDAPSKFNVLKVDHTTVLKSDDTVDIVRDQIEK